MKSIKEIVEWILKNRKGNAFKNYSELKIVCLIQEGVRDNTFYFVEDKEKHILGVACGIKIADNMIEAHDVLTVKTGILKQFIIEFSNQFHDFKIKAKRKNKTIIFSDIKKLKRRII